MPHSSVDTASQAQRIVTTYGEVIISLASDARDLAGILALQRANLNANLSEQAALRDGFLTVAHTADVLAQMQAQMPSVVARCGSEIVGYALSMPLACRTIVPILEPMFQLFETLEYRGTPLRDARFYVMGQICIADRWRGQGLFQALYAQHGRCFAPSYDLVVTEVSRRNARSLRAHKRVGFDLLHHYRDATDDWSVVALDFRGGSREQAG